MKRTMWMVRSASGGSLADSFHEKNIVAIGWGDVGDLKKYKDKEALIAAVKANWSEWSDGRT